MSETEVETKIKKEDDKILEINITDEEVCEASGDINDEN